MFVDMKGKKIGDYFINKKELAFNAKFKHFDIKMIYEMHQETEKTNYLINTKTNENTNTKINIT